jgi:hypothetical protein
MKILKEILFYLAVFVSAVVAGAATTALVLFFTKGH